MISLCCYQKKKGNRTGPFTVFAISAFVLVCFHWQHTERGLQNRRRFEDEDKSTETEEELNDVSHTGMLKLIR